MDHYQDRYLICPAIPFTLDKLSSVENFVADPPISEGFHYYLLCLHLEFLNEVAHCSLWQWSDWSLLSQCID